MGLIQRNLRALADSQAIGGGPEAAHAYDVRLLRTVNERLRTHTPT